MTTGDNLDNLIHNIQAKKPPPAGNKQEEIVQVSELTCKENLETAWVIFRVRMERKVHSYDSGPQYVWTNEATVPVLCGVKLCGLSTRERETKILQKALENGLGQAPNFIHGYEWVDEEKKLRLRRRFAEPFTRG